MDCDGKMGWSRTARQNLAAVFEDDATFVVYVKGHKKGTWLWNLLPDDEWERMYIEIFDTVYEGMEFLTNLDDYNTIRCDRHAKNCALQNVFKIFNWWSGRQEEL